jgi:hypothetical protein
MRWLCLLAIALVSSASAQQVHKCIDGGKTVYQSQPCEKGEPLKSWSAKPDAPNPYRQARLDQIARELDQRKAADRYAAQGRQYSSGSGVRGASISILKDAGRCEAAKAERDRIYNAVGVRRSFELSRQLDDRVYEACK